MKTQAASWQGGWKSHLLLQALTHVLFLSNRTNCPRAPSTVGWLFQDHTAFSLGPPKRGIMLFSLTTPDFLDKSPARGPGWLDRGVGGCAMSCALFLLRYAPVTGELWVRRYSWLSAGAPAVSQSTGPPSSRSGSSLTTLHFLRGGQVLLGSSRNHRGGGVHV